MNNQDLNIILSELSFLEQTLIDRMVQYSSINKKRIYALGCNISPIKDHRVIGDYAKLEVATIIIAQRLIEAAGTLLWHSVYDEKKRKQLLDMCEDLSFKAYQAIQQAKDGDNG